MSRSCYEVESELCFLPMEKGRTTDDKRHQGQHREALALLLPVKLPPELLLQVL